MGRGDPGSVWLRRWGECSHSVAGYVEVFGEASDFGSGIVEFVPEVEAVVLLGFLGFLACRFEEVSESFQQAVGRCQDLVQ
ncbi:hypothetical protein [Streptomyces hebeiensis]|uniref:hypothetical protein n=1 Tax=Streptomyces hebeiensis TaxID=229486 RepID=UPI0031D8F4A8